MWCTLVSGYIQLSPQFWGKTFHGKTLEERDPSGLASCERNHPHGLESPWSLAAVSHCSLQSELAANTP